MIFLDKPLLTATWDAMNHACLWLSCTDMKGAAAIGLQLFLYDIPAQECERVKSDWSELLARLFPRAVRAELTAGAVSVSSAKLTKRIRKRSAAIYLA